MKVVVRWGLLAVLMAGCGRGGVLLDAFSATATDGSTDDDDGPGDDDDDGGEECRVDSECPVPPDSCSAGKCEAGTCSIVLRDADGDGYGPVDCGGDDCNDLNPNSHPGQAEDCHDGDDNNCDGVADCLDPVCDPSDCGCVPAVGGEICTGSLDEDCDTTVDCNDLDCIGTPACGCAEGESTLCDNGFDDDCDGSIDCEDAECSDATVCVCMATVEQCSGGVDDDCDLLVDCADPDCDGLFPCQCAGPPVPEQCADGLDNDCDSLVDCADTDCIVSPACSHCSSEQCGDGADNDCDGRIDCADDACAFAPECSPIPEVCNNGLDDDFDGLVDCDDPDCVAVPICQQSHGSCATATFLPGTGTYFGDTFGHTNNTSGSCGGGAGEAVFYFVLNTPSHVVLDSIGTSFDSVLYVRAGSCSSGIEIGCDDDSANSQWAARLDFTLLLPGTYYVFLDGYTIDPVGGPNEGSYQLNVEIVADPPEVCGDGIDNDGDVYADCGDPDCQNVPPCAGCNAGADPTAEFGNARCTDGLDNDCDGDIDCEDEDCSASDYYVTECCNGIDENGNGTPDDFNCRCNNDSECSGGQICYDHTANACGPPCEQFFGDVCPFVAAGSVCNGATQQCEF